MQLQGSRQKQGGSAAVRGPEHRRPSEVQGPELQVHELPACQRLLVYMHTRAAGHAARLGRLPSTTNLLIDGPSMALPLPDLSQDGTDWLPPDSSKHKNKPCSLTGSAALHVDIHGHGQSAAICGAGGDCDACHHGPTPQPCVSHVIHRRPEVGKCGFWAQWTRPGLCCSAAKAGWGLCTAQVQAVCWVVLG